MAFQAWPDKYNSGFAVQITSNVMNSQQMSISFANNNLNGHGRFLPGYKSSKTRVCVTVGMMTTVMIAKTFSIWHYCVQSFRPLILCR